MARSRDFRKYTIVTKKPNYSVHKYTREEDESLPESINSLIVEEQDKTFWLFKRHSGDLVGRYSVDSAPQWIMEIYNILVKEDVE